MAHEADLNPNVSGLTPSATVAINERSDALRREGMDIFKLGLGQSPFPVPASVVQRLKDCAHEKNYLPVAGLYELRQAVANYHQRKSGISYDADQVIVGPGSKELMFLLQLVYAGELLLAAPMWVSYEPQARILGRPATYIETRADQRWRLQPERLDQHCRPDPSRPRLLFLNYPNNPTGTSYTPDELAALAAVARRYNVVIISDEIYGELDHTGDYRTIASVYPEGTICSSGLSKWCGAGGWRLGTFVLPENLKAIKEAMAAVASETFTSTSAPIQYAAVRAFEGGEDIDHYLTTSRRVLQALGNWIHNRLAQAQISSVAPEGGFYLFADFSAHAHAFEAKGIGSGAVMCERLLQETGVAILPGSCFGQAETDLTARLSYVNFDGAAALASAADVPEHTELDERWLSRFCNRTLRATERICSWVEAT